MKKELPKAYDPKMTEQKTYTLWEKSGFFNPDKLPARHKKPFSIAIPPPNVTGELHMGHALNAVIQDVIIRKKRMEGYKALWLPGTDHAGIATQNKVEQKLRKEGKTRFDLGRERFVEEVWAWKEKYGDIILDQLKQIGASCDWSRTRFTMDEEYAKAVETAFAHYYEKGWIYQGLRVVNWCARCGTSLSDLELEYEEAKGTLWHIKYPIKSSKEFIVVATTRPETMLGDAAVAVNPKDKRYEKLIGKTAILPIQEREIPIIADDAVDAGFGTGAVKVTPLHDFNDWDIGERHKLPHYKVIDERGRMTKEAGPLCEGTKIRECREKILADLEEKGLLEKTEELTHQIPRCYRCNGIIEPLASKQWFLKMGELAKTAIDAVKKGDIRFVPKKWEKVYLARLKNERDWNISRQLWWGHRLPVWKHEAKCAPKPGREEEVEKCEEIQVSNKEPKCKHCDAKYIRSEDVLDTWFSSALWPFATLGWPVACAPNKKLKLKMKNYCVPQSGRDLDVYFPTNVLSTARDIISIWVARMIFSSQEFMGKKPFTDVVVHATVLTKDGKRMSKSLGTGIDPVGLIEKYGADATRFGIAYQMMGGQDIHFSEDHIMAGKKFANKLWNISRFVLLQISNVKCQTLNKANPPAGGLTAKTTADEEILDRLKKIVITVSDDIDTYRLGHAAHALYDFVWHDFADVYIEKSKKEKNESLLFYVLLETLKLLHPFMPFITEEIYQTLPLKNKTMLVVEKWPK